MLLDWHFLLRVAYIVRRIVWVLFGLLQAFRIRVEKPAVRVILALSADLVVLVGDSVFLGQCDPRRFEAFARWTSMSVTRAQLALCECIALLIIEDVEAILTVALRYFDLVVLVILREPALGADLLI